MTKISVHEPAIEAIDLCKDYMVGDTRLHALRHINLCIYPGEVVAIMGPSGCGKTTLLNCLSGLDAITSGTVRVAGRDITKLSDRQLTRFRSEEMGFIFQAYNLIPVLSGVENVELPLLVSRVSSAEARERAWASITRVGLSRERGLHRPAALSGGEQQRLAIARALASRPSIVWADEPTGALDSRTSQKVVSLMLALNREFGLTFVWVTHSEEVAATAHRLITMKDGDIVGNRSLPARGV